MLSIARGGAGTGHESSRLSISAALGLKVGGVVQRSV